MGGRSSGGARNSSPIEYNEEGEVIFKFSGTDKSTGKRVIGMEISARTIKDAKQDIRANGYTVSANKLLPRKMFDEIMNNMNGYSWEWEEAYKEAKKLIGG